MTQLHFYFLLISLHRNVADSTAPATVDRNAGEKRKGNEIVSLNHRNHVYILQLFTMSL